MVRISIFLTFFRRSVALVLRDDDGIDDLLDNLFRGYVLRFGFTPEKIFHLACRAFGEDFDRETVKKWLKNFYRRFVCQQFKRSCLPDGVKVGSVCLSPRGDWRMPSDASARAWLDRAEAL